MGAVIAWRGAGARGPDGRGGAVPWAVRLSPPGMVAPPGVPAGERVPGLVSCLLDSLSYTSLCIDDPAAPPVRISSSCSRSPRRVPVRVAPVAQHRAAPGPYGVGGYPVVVMRGKAMAGAGGPADRRCAGARRGVHGCAQARCRCPRWARDGVGLQAYGGAPRGRSHVRRVENTTGSVGSVGRSPGDEAWSAPTRTELSWD